MLFLMQNFTAFYFHMLLFPLSDDLSFVLVWFGGVFVVDKVFCPKVQDKMETMSVVW